MTSTQIQPASRGEARIVVGADGSASSIAALQRAVRIASALGLPLEGVSVWHYPDVYGGYMGEAFVPSTDELVRGAQAMLDDTADAVFGPDRPSWFHGTVREGGTAAVLLEESEGAEMLVVGSRGHGGFVGLLLGSVSEACAEHATCPVLVFHDTAATDGFTGIVVGIDGSEESIGALRRGAAIATAMHLSLKAVSAWQYPTMYGASIGEAFVPSNIDLASLAQSDLDRAVTAVFGATPPEWVSSANVEGGAAETLLDASRSAEMLVVGSRGHSGIAGLLLGSVSGAAAEHAACPVLVNHVALSTVQPARA